MATISTADRVRETSVTTGTGTLNLDGAVSKYQTFVQGVGTGATVTYCVVHRDVSEWEVGYGVITDASPDTLSRASVSASSNAGSLVNFSAGTKDVFITHAADYTATTDTNQDLVDYAKLSGRSGGQSLIGGIAASETLTLESTSHSTKGDVISRDNLTVYARTTSGISINLHSAGNVLLGEIFQGSDSVGGDLFTHFKYASSDKFFYSTSDVFFEVGLELQDNPLQLDDSGGIGRNVLVTSGTDIVTFGSASFSKITTPNQLESTLAIGTAPLVVTSTTLVSNLNADLLDGNEASAFALVSHNHSATDITSGTLSVARGGTGVTSSTGTTAIVLSTSPTLVTPLLGVASATSLACPTFTTSSGAMSITPAAGSNLNIILGTTGDFIVNTSDLVVDTSLNRVGIGTASPSYSLHVNGSSTVVAKIGRSTAADTRFLFGNSAGDTTFRTDASGNGELYADTGKTLGVGANGLASHIKITSAGYVGIGVTATAWLHTKASTTTAASFNVPTGTAPTSPNNGDIWSDGSDLLIRLGGVTYTFTKT